MSMALFLGNGLATLIAAHEAARQGRAVTLVTDGGRLGGHFAGLCLEGLDFDIGMVFYEQCLTQKTEDKLSSYAPHIRNDWTRFGHEVSQWLNRHVNLVRSPTPECLINGNKVPDYLIANRLEAFLGTTPPEITDEHDPRHASHKAKTAIYDHLNYAQAAEFNHGKALHQRFIEPFVRKILGVDSSQIMARFHRTGWLPLYYPDTLRAASQGKKTPLLEYPFWTNETGFAGELVKRLVTDLVAWPHAQIFDQKITGLQRLSNAWRIGLSDGSELTSDAIALGISPKRACELLEIPNEDHAQAASVALLFARVKAQVIEVPHACTMIVDETFATYRLCDQDVIAGQQPAWHRVTLEASPDALHDKYPTLTLEQALTLELKLLMCRASTKDEDIQIMKCMNATHALILPTQVQIQRSQTLTDALRNKVGNMQLTGALLGFGVSSMNDQITQGLKIAGELQ